jgi:hypothetical protein
MWFSAKNPPNDNQKVLVAHLPRCFKTRATPISRKFKLHVTTARFSGGKWRFLEPRDKTRRIDGILWWQPIENPPY